MRVGCLAITGAVTPEAIGAGLAYGAKLKKQTVETKDKAGFIVNRLLVPYLLDGIRGLEEGIGAAVPCYGGGPDVTPDEAARIDVPILAIYGGQDRGVSPEVAQRRAALMEAAGVAHEMVIYPNAQHAFMNDRRPAYNPEAAEDAWRRLLAFFRETLK